MQFVGLFLAAIVVEGIISYINKIRADEFRWQNFAAILLGIFVSVIYRIDIFDIFGLTPLIPYVGRALTGILISRGSNYIYDIIKSITNFPKKLLLEDKKEGAVSNEPADSALPPPAM